MNSAVIHFAGVFIIEKVQFLTVLRIEGKMDVKKQTDSTFYVSGMVEEFNSLNYPVGVKHFNKTLVYSGSNPNKKKSWNCNGIKNEIIFSEVEYHKLNTIFFIKQIFFLKIYNYHFSLTKKK